MIVSVSGTFSFMFEMKSLKQLRLFTSYRYSIMDVIVISIPLFVIDNLFDNLERRMTI